MNPVRDGQRYLSELIKNDKPTVAYALSVYKRISDVFRTGLEAGTHRAAFYDESEKKHIWILTDGGMPDLRTEDVKRFMKDNFVHRIKTLAQTLFPKDELKQSSTLDFLFKKAGIDHTETYIMDTKPESLGKIGAFENFIKNEIEGETLKSPEEEEQETAHKNSTEYKLAQLKKDKAEIEENIKIIEQNIINLKNIDLKTAFQISKTGNLDADVNEIKNFVKRDNVREAMKYKCKELLQLYDDLQNPKFERSNLNLDILFDGDVKSRFNNLNLRYDLLEYPKLKKELENLKIQIQKYETQIKALEPPIPKESLSVEKPQTSPIVEVIQPPSIDKSVEKKEPEKVKEPQAPEIRPLSGFRRFLNAIAWPFATLFRAIRRLFG